MLRRTMTAAALIALTIMAGTALAQPEMCVVGAYADADGTQSVFTPVESRPFDIFTVMHVESTVAGVAYQIVFPPEIEVLGSPSYGPNGGGINVPRNGGDNIGLGECAIGFNGNPIVIAQYQAIVFDPVAYQTEVELHPNPENPTAVQYADCADQLWNCETNLNLLLEPTIPNGSESFGAVKSLYGN